MMQHVLVMSEEQNREETYSGRTVALADITRSLTARSRSRRTKHCYGQGLGSTTRTPLVRVGGRSPARPLLGRSKVSVAVSHDECERHSECADPLVGLTAAVISLERRPDRMVGCASRLQLRCPWLPYAAFPACDGRVTTMRECDVVTTWDTSFNVTYQRKRSMRKGWDDLDTYKERALAMSAGERGCAVSHIRLWERLVAEGGDAPLLVLEDDAAPTEEFTDILSRALRALPEDAHVLYLGYSQAADWRRTVSPELVEAEYVWTTVAYLIWPAGAKVLLSGLPVDQPVDNYMATLCAKGELKSYCVRPKIVLQADAWNVNSDVGHSDEHYWGPCSDIMHSDEFYWDPEDKHLAADFQAGANEDVSEGAPSGRGRTKSLFWDVDSEDSGDDNDVSMF